MNKMLLLPKIQHSSYKQVLNYSMIAMNEAWISIGIGPSIPSGAIFTRPIKTPINKQLCHIKNVYTLFQFLWVFW